MRPCIIYFGFFTRYKYTSLSAVESKIVVVVELLWLNYTSRISNGCATIVFCMHWRHLNKKVNQKSFNKKLKECRDDSCKSKETRWDDSCKSKGTSWDDTCKSKTHPSEPRPTLKCQVSLHQRLVIIS